MDIFWFLFGFYYYSDINIMLFVYRYGVMCNLAFGYFIKKLARGGVCV